MSAPAVAIIDSGGANINSIVFALERLGCHPQFTSDWNRIQAASHVVLPGVGAAAAAMQRLQETGLAGRIPQLQQPVIGICLGMQLLFENSAEGDVDCLGIIPGKVERLPAAGGLTIPHMGWNRNFFGDQPASPLTEGLQNGFHAYFVHSYAAPTGPWTVARCQHGRWFSSIVAYRNFTGIQFHPERSGAAGETLLRQFLRSQSKVQA
jgi:glutamine amidotransferase